MLSLISLLYLLTGTVAGLLAGLFGIGGGLVIVPLLIFVFSFDPTGFHPDRVSHVAIASSLATICFTSIASARQHIIQSPIDWRDVQWLVPGLLVGAVLGALIAGQLDGKTLSIAIGVFAILTALQMSLHRIKEEQVMRYAGPRLLPIGCTIGVASSIFGVGGGSITVPFLSWAGRSIHQAIATSAACTVPIAFAATLTYALLTDPSYDQPFSTGYIYWPAVLAIVLTSVPSAWVGARAAKKLPPVLLKRLFAGYLLIISIYLIGPAYAPALY
ncbi:MAG: sulfite exporter TauE/SafE family protein [Gammaproteobacteria bacterium]